MNELVQITVDQRDLAAWFEICDEIQKVKVVYDDDQLKMAQDTIKEIKKLSMEILNGVNCYPIS